MGLSHIAGPRAVDPPPWMAYCPSVYDSCSKLVYLIVSLGVAELTHLYEFSISLCSSRKSRKAQRMCLHACVDYLIYIYSYKVHFLYLHIIYIYMAVSQNSRSGSTPKTHRRSRPPIQTCDPDRSRPHDPDL